MSEKSIDDMEETIPPTEDPRERDRDLTSGPGGGDEQSADPTHTNQADNVSDGTGDASTELSDTLPTIRNQEDTQPVRVGQTSAPPPFGGEPNRPFPPSSQRLGEPLPNRVSEVDLDATRVSPAAYIAPSQGSPLRYSTPPVRRSAARPTPPPARTSQPPPRRGDRFGCLLQFLFGSLFLMVMVVLCGLSIAFYQYYNIARTLPDIDDLRQNASQFETTQILDRNGDVLYEIIDPNAGRRTYVNLDKISPYLVAATIATEDKGFYSHPGFDPIAIGRAFWQNYQGGGVVSGASTITQQLSRTLLFTPEERSRTVLPAQDFARPSLQRRSPAVILKTRFWSCISTKIIMATWLTASRQPQKLISIPLRISLPWGRPLSWRDYHRRQLSMMYIAIRRLPSSAMTMSWF